MSPRSTTRPSFCVLPPIRHSSNDRCLSVRQNEVLRPSSLLHRSLLSYFWLSSGSTWESFPISPILYPLLPLPRESSWLEASDKICEPNCSAVVNCHPFLQYVPHDDSVNIHPFAVLWIHRLPKYTKVLIWFHWICHGSLQSFLFLPCKTRHSRSHWRFQFLTSILHGFLEFLVF